MDSDAIQLVQDSFATIAPRAVVFGAEFYDRLFLAAPEVRGMFADEMAPQVLKLIQTLSTVVADLKDPEGMRDQLLYLGAVHAELGALPAHYPVVAEALIGTLEHWLGEDFTPDCRAAWTAALTHVATVMIEGAEAAAPQNRAVS